MAFKYFLYKMQMGQLPWFSRLNAEEKVSLRHSKKECYEF